MYKKTKNIFKSSLLFQVFLSLGAGFILAPFLPHSLICFFYSISCAIKDLLIFFLPIIIISYLVSSIISYENNASKIIAGIFVGVILSICIALVFSYIAGLYFLPLIVHPEHISALSSQRSAITPLFTISLKNISTDIAMIIALTIAFWINILGSSYIKRLRNSYYNKQENHKELISINIICGLLSLGIFMPEKYITQIKKVFFKIRNISEKYLMRYFIPLVPLYILGFILKISVEATSISFLKDFGKIFIFNFITIIIYVCFSYLLIARFSFHKMLIYLKNMLPATITGFSTMSSVATMPITIQAIEKNFPNDNHQFIKCVIPTTVNIHAIGDVINIALSGLALLLMNSQPIPSLMSYLLFVIYTCLAQFSCVSIPGGGIIVMTAILQKYLGLSIESTMLLTSIYFILEPFLTAANITYNGSFTIGLRKILNIKE